MNATSTVRGVGFVLGLVGLLGMGVAAFAQPSSRSPLAPPPNGPRKSEPGDGFIALKNATIHVRPGETIEKGTVVFRAGMIESVAAGDAVPVGAEPRDAAGMHIYAGFLEPYFEVDVPKPDPSAPGSHWNTSVTPQRNALDKGASGIATKDAETLRSMGFVAAAISPRGGIFRGSSALVSLAQLGTEPSDALPRVYADKVYQCVALDRAGEDSPGELPGQTPGGPRAPRASERGNWSSYPSSQMGSIALVRQTLSDADWQAAESDAAWRNGGHPDLASALSNVSSRVNLISMGDPDKEIPERVRLARPMLFDADDELETLRSMKIASEFYRHADILGSGFEFRRVEAISNAAKDGVGIPVRFIEPLNFPRTPRVSTIGEQEAAELRDLINWEQAPTNLRRMDAAGLTVALTTSKISERQGGRRAFKENLSSAIKHGLKPDRALAMLTTNAAQILGASDRFGTIEKGKVASIILTDGELFTDKPDAPKKGEPGYVRPGRIIDVYIDGRRHAIAGKQRHDLGGTWDITLEPGPKAGSNVKITFEIDDEFPPAITIVKRSTDEAGKEQKATTKAQSVSVEEDGRIRFTFDHEPFGEKGVFVSAGLIEKGADGEPVMRGESIRSGGQMLRWSAVRTSKELPKPEKRRERGGRRGEDAGKKEGGDAASAEKNAVAEKGDSAPKGGTGGLPASDVGSKDTKPLADKPPVPPAEAGTEEKKDEPRKSKTPEQDAIAAIPEKLGLPLGPYASDEPAKSEIVVLKGATIWTSGPLGVIENGAIVLDGGRITAIGKAGEVQIPLVPDVRTIDAAGKHITPGIIDCHSHTGISRGVNEGGQSVTSEVRIADVTDPDSISWYRQLGGGVTCVNNLHGSANTIGGQNQVNKNRWGCIAPDDMHFAGAMPGIKFALGENVKQSNGDRQSTRYPVTRMGVETLLRDRFTAAREYAAVLKGYTNKEEQWQKDHQDKMKSKSWGLDMHADLGDAPRRDLELEALAEILEGKRLVHCHSYRQDEILMLCRIADEFNFKIGTFQHGLEVYKVADVVKTHAIGASIFSDWWAYKVEVQDAIPYAGPLQTQVGVLTSYNSDSDEMARRLNVEAGKAAKYSDGRISPEEALKFVTINPAKQLKIDDKVGSLEAGKDADIAVWSGPPLSSLSRCERTFVDGRELFSLEKDAAMREKNRAERARIIQKVLAAGPGSRGTRGPGGRGEGDAEGKPDAGAPTDDVAMDDEALVLAARRSVMARMYQQQDDLRREKYLNLLMRGLDPRFHTAGECGCEGN